MKEQLREFEVAIPAPDGRSEVEQIKILVPMKWDDDLGEFLLTPEAHEKIENTKARYMGILLPEELRALRERLNLSQRGIGELLQIGEKSWTRWESGKQRPSRMVNLLLRALYDGEIRVEYLERLTKPNATWARTVEHLESHQSARRYFIRMDEAVSFQVQEEYEEERVSSSIEQLLGQAA